MSNFTDAQIKILTNFYLKLDTVTDEFFDIYENNRTLLLRNVDINYIQNNLNAAIDSIDSAMKPVANSTVVGKWATSQVGITHSISAALGLHIDINNFENVGSLWRHAGLDPTQKNNSSSHSPELKSLCWRIGTNFAEFAKEKNCFYGKLYLQDKARRLESNNKGEYSEKAEKILQDLDPRFTDDKSILLEGKLSDAQIDAQARRFSVKIFLSHYYAVAYQDTHGVPANRPTKITVDGKKQTLNIPNNPFEES